YPDGELVGIWKRRAAIARVYNGVLAQSHGIALNVLRYALTGARLEVEAHGERRRGRQAEQNNHQKIAGGHGLQDPDSGFSGDVRKLVALRGRTRPEKSLRSFFWLIVKRPGSLV
ncbi:hypothetical protein TorRG33x02_079450, partial [Trema orientale]